MKRKYLAKAGVLALTAGIILPSTIANGETLPSSVSTSIVNEVSDETPVIDVYDKDRNLIKTYTKESSVAKFLGIKIDEEFVTNYYVTINNFFIHCTSKNRRLV
ncbi:MULTISPECIES: hypothetical protein [Bacillus cereus group]|uniref:Uncharacterized protein n=1 Tax=Bacillus cereus VD118 TaxID=1053231 RepID=R8QAL2_BACCE|nr:MULTISPECIES: hypothetical protein [Bacillus cereus group]EOP67428.1 hypothetical protein IIQ_05381 [Bacillus cereus VD118]MCQ6359488.1 hypothetical protein [Bacillus cereus]CAH2464407.1 hypothetical protein ACOSJ1_EBGNOMHC_04941 [Bacillus mycoides KBAB4]